MPCSSAAQTLRLLHAGGAHQHRLAGGVRPPDLLQHRLFFRRLVGENSVRLVHANHRAVGRDHLHVQLVALRNSRPAWRRCRSCRRSRGYRATRFCSVMDAEHRGPASNGDALLGFDGGVQSGGPAAVLRDAALELVHRFDGAVLHHVIHVAVQQGVRMDARLEWRCRAARFSLIDRVAAADRASTTRIPASVSAMLRPNSSSVKCEAATEAAHQDRRGARGSLRPPRRPRTPAECALRRSGWNRPRR